MIECGSLTMVEYSRSQAIMHPSVAIGDKPRHKSCIHYHCYIVMCSKHKAVVSSSVVMYGKEQAISVIRANIVVVYGE